ncbi:cytochrome-c peroxidase [Thalassococcus sp. S3]|uniref:cytochrome-c peroxidase n=1 Tax=Thalassococcus sp. S3 TaxID=2017482 RepID=UPI0013EEE115|nr:cytochrome c peroxidase [Thalassococcus sp. S3]
MLHADTPAIAKERETMMTQSPRLRRNATERLAHTGAPSGRPMPRLARVALSFAFFVWVSPPQAVAEEPISPLPTYLDLDPAKVALGEAMFNDPRLSATGEHACSRCHVIGLGGSDGFPTSPGIDGEASATNSLSIFNTSFNFRLNWDGRNLSPTEQVTAVVENPVLMGGSWPQIVKTLNADPGTLEAFQEVYGDTPSQANIVDAIIEYERSLTTPNAPFDRYLRGDQTALSDAALQGYQDFKSLGCVACHQGINVGGNMMQVFGVFGEPAAAAAGPETPGASKSNLISDERPVFRVPSLRNVALTAPYFHDGSVETLPEAIDIMAEYQLGRRIDDATVDRIVAFLNALTGEYRGVPLDQLSHQSEGE